MKFPQAARPIPGAQPVRGNPESGCERFDHRLRTVLGQSEIVVERAGIVSMTNNVHA